MTFTVEVEFDAPPAAVFGYLADPVNRPFWQSSLRRVDAVTHPSGELGLGTSWIDVTLPGLRPKMVITAYQPDTRWAERGTWRGVVVDLVLEFSPLAAGTLVRGTTRTQAAGWRRPVDVLLRAAGPVAARDDLRRANRILRETLG